MAAVTTSAHDCCEGVRGGGGGGGAAAAVVLLALISEQGEGGGRDTKDKIKGRKRPVSREVGNDAFAPCLLLFATAHALLLLVDVQLWHVTASEGAA